MEDRDACKTCQVFGIRIEDDVLVTAEGCAVVTAGIPKTVDEVETAVRVGG